MWSVKSCNFLVVFLILKTDAQLYENRIDCGEVNDTMIPNPPDGVCPDIDVKNTYRNLKLLTNCTVIEGSLHISLFHNVHKSEYEKYSFPKLREITGYLMLYRVYGLESLQNLFPNLRVIRGHTLFFRLYALVVHELPDLKDLGLIDLVTIPNGAVRLTNNHNLCYVNTIDWSRLAPGVDPSKHQIINNRDELMCTNICNDSCPAPSGPKSKRCWNSQADACQKDADVSSSCHKYCLGGCTGPRKSQCIACTNVTLNGECWPYCPKGTYMYMNYRCLTDHECMKLKKHFPRAGTPEKISHKLYHGEEGKPSQCVFMCPPNFMDNQNNDIKECVPCQGVCPKDCENKGTINRVQDTEYLFGCTTLKGNLIIVLSSKSTNLQQELTKNLGLIRNVTGYIKIMFSVSLLSLNFLKSLEYIGGSTLVHQNYSLLVKDNINLEKLFPEEQTKKLFINRGVVSFHGNRKLCIREIETFKNLSQSRHNSSSVTYDWNTMTNGDNSPCDEALIRLTVEKMNVLQVEISLHLELQDGDTRRIAGYQIYYKNVTEPVNNIYEIKDACSTSAWMTDWISLETKTYNITHLNADTVYAVYVEATNLASATTTAVSKVVYFRTSPSVPKEPVELKFSSTDPHEMVVSWRPPLETNGNVTHYKVLSRLQPWNNASFHQMDKCKSDGYVLAKREEQVKEEDKEDVNLNETCCACPKAPGNDYDENSLILDVYFEDHIQGIVYIRPLVETGKCVNTTLLHLPRNNTPEEHMTHSVQEEHIVQPVYRKSGLDFSDPITHHDLPKVEIKRNSSVSTSSTLPGDNSSSGSEPNKNLEVIVYDTHITLTNLEHYHSYHIEVIACHETDPVTNKKLCGKSAVGSSVTMPDVQADNINSSLVSVQVVSRDVLVKWEPPPHPNGLLLMYNIQVKKMVEVEIKPTTFCVSLLEYMNSSKSYLLKDFGPGNYSLQIRAISLAGNGTYTPAIYFQVYQDSPDSPTNMLVGIIVAAVALISLVVIIVFVRLRSKRKDAVIVSQNANYIPTELLYSADEWEIPRENIRLIKELGQGSFGTVFEGLMDDPEYKSSIPVAIKTVGDKADFHERLKILKEATTMKVFECHHVVKLLGVVSKSQPALIIMELMSLGDLRNHLRKCRLDQEEFPDFEPPTVSEIYQMAGEIADGMAYLAHRKIVHRDLAARNCLVAEDRTVKIADFGMARDVYMTEYYRKDQRALLPVRWMAPESLKDGIFTTMSDVWSFGVVLWEMVTLGEQPYQGLGNDEVLNYVIGRKMMSSPVGCPPDLYSLMLMCWTYKPELRPSFKELIQILSPHLNSKFEDVSFYYKELKQLNAESQYVEQSPGIDGATGEDQGLCPNDEVPCPADGSTYPTLQIGRNHWLPSDTESDDERKDQGSERLKLLPASTPTNEYTLMSPPAHKTLSFFPTSPLQTSPLQTSPLQTSPLQTSPLQTSPLQTSPLQTSPLQTSPLQTSPLQSASSIQTSSPKSSPVQRLLPKLFSQPTPSQQPSQPTPSHQPSQPTPSHQSPQPSSPVNKLESLLQTGLNCAGETTHRLTKSSSDGSSSSSGSNYHSTSNGHGPYPHQQPALC